MARMKAATEKQAVPINRCDWLCMCFPILILISSTMCQRRLEMTKQHFRLNSKRDLNKFYLNCKCVNDKIWKRSPRWLHIDLIKMEKKKKTHAII